ncbi:MAG: H-NS histone family protein [Burkholderiales bacterium]|nr:H-NS histone family protein [Burkholderiales bacterium]
MAKTYADIQKEIASLQKAAETLRQKEVAGVIERIKDAIATYQLTAQDLGLGKSAAPARQRRQGGGRAGAAGAAPAKYRDASGKTWSGRGRRPGWITEALAAGRNLEDLRA